MFILDEIHRSIFSNSYTLVEANSERRGRRKRRVARNDGCLEGIAETQKGGRNGTTSCQTQGHGLFQRSASLGLLTFRRTPAPSERAITNYARIPASLYARRMYATPVLPMFPRMGWYKGIHHMTCSRTGYAQPPYSCIVRRPSVITQLLGGEGVPPREEYRWWGENSISRLCYIIYRMRSDVLTLFGQRNGSIVIAVGENGKKTVWLIFRIGSCLNIGKYILSIFFSKTVQMEHSKTKERLIKL